MTVQQREKNKKVREEKIKQKQIEHGKIHRMEPAQSLSDNYLEDTILPESSEKSQELLAPFNGQQMVSNTDNSMQFSFTTIGDETVIGGFNMEQLQIGTGQSPTQK